MISKVMQSPVSAQNVQHPVIQVSVGIEARHLAQDTTTREIIAREEQMSNAASPER